MRPLLYAALWACAACKSVRQAETVAIDFGAEDLRTPPDPFELPGRCSSGKTRDPNSSEGEEMTPGHACNTCHAEKNAASGEGDAPIFAFAGTLFPSGHEPNDCLGAAAEGAEVTVTDALGTIHVAPANASGNFLFESENFAYPYRAKVIFQGRVRTMIDPQTIGDCNHCHTESGAEKAPGRIVLP